MAADMSDLLAQLDAQTAGLCAALEEAGAETGESCWDLATPAERWSVRDQLTHLAYFDELATMSILLPARFRIEARILMAGGMDFPDRIAHQYASMPGDEVLMWFRSAREEFASVARRSDPSARLPWFGPDMSVTSTVTARLMETWAHGRDVHDTLGTVQPTGPELRSVAHLGVATFGFVHQLHHREIPSTLPRVELAGPSGEQWVWGPEDSTDSVRGHAEDFALAVTQRRNLADTDLEITGDVARNWMTIAQTYAGTPGTGRPPLNEPTDTTAARGHQS
ncbi:TIGR03084 family metal-binding protein [Dietzia sp. PP-33]|jgi:uncharacterized protein (TIGR03084 family)|uniref:TIGR03084 family metal-binding protein n=1 Tax=Dietzia sp. PP-33 TaxID=2957500 RepID=UPI0029ACF717|nr:TIGR03084 family metal-binding protein [Dietzia sp. PP-33]MDX2358696.1 TIGR03084 family metal-binding protein [Dietzia sp. PP-33]